MTRTVMRHDWLASVFLFVFAASLYAPSLQNGFVYDDHKLIEEQAPPVVFTDLVRSFTQGHRHFLPYYRPISWLTIDLQLYLNGNTPAPYHLFNTFLLGLITVLGYLFLRLPIFGAPRIAALMAAMLFASHPIASACVYPITGREALLAAFFALASVYAFTQRGMLWHFTALIFFVLSLLSREQGIVLVALFVLIDIFGLSASSPHGLRQWLSRYSFLVVMVGSYLLLRWFLYSASGEHQLALFTYPQGPVYSLLYALQTIGTPFVHLRYEPTFSAWFSPLRQLICFLTVVLIIVLFSKAWRNRPLCVQVLFWLSWFLISLLPTANFSNRRLDLQNGTSSWRFMALSVSW